MRRQGTRIAIMAAGTALLLGVSGSFAAEQRGQLSEKDYKFVVNAARGGMTEVEAGQLAKQKGTSDAVRNLGDHMVTEHGKVNNELRDIVTRKGGALPDALSRSENSLINRLEKLNGVDFDKAYATEMVKDHKKDLKEFQDAANELSDPDLKSFAQRTAIVIEEHLRMANDTEATVKGETK